MQAWRDGAEASASLLSTKKAQTQLIVRGCAHGAAATRSQARLGLEAEHLTTDGLRQRKERQPLRLRASGHKRANTSVCVCVRLRECVRSQA
eukprot:372593-Pleurochrysis_carterae.AAC.2